MANGKVARRVYLDWNSTTPPRPEVLDAWRTAAAISWANPSSLHDNGQRARECVEQVRDQVGALFEAHPRDVIFTSGGTEANNLALLGAKGLALSRIEHPSVTRVAEVLASRKIPVRWLPVSEDGVIEIQAAADALSELPKGSTLCAMAANHECGVMQPLAALSEVVGKFCARLHVDAVQLLGKYPVESAKLADSVALASHKIRGTKGTGALIIRGQPPEPVLLGGSQERGLRPGTLDVAGIAAFGEALRWLPKMEAMSGRLSVLRARIEMELLALGASLHGTGAPRLSSVCNFATRDWPGPELVAALDLAGVSVSSGSACSAGTAEPSQAIQAMLGSEVASRAVRLSLGELTTDEDVSFLLDQLRTLLQT